MKFDILQLDAFTFPSSSGLEQDLIVKAETQFGHSR